jgi:beta-lactamase regulating signal transducer with metallopeptidase domain
MPQAVWTVLIENSLIFSVLFFCVWLLKAAFGRRLSAALHYALWAVVVAKLLIPVSFTAQWSPYVLWQNAQRPAAAAPAHAYEQPSGRNAITLPDDELQSGDWAGIPVPNAFPAVPDTSPRPASPSVRVDWASAAVCVWLAGALSMAAWVAFRASRLKRKIARSGAGEPPRWMEEELRRCKEELGVRKDVRLVVQSALPVPATMGLLKTALIVPESLARGCGGERLRHVFLHELAHVRRGDLWAIWVLNALNVVYWFNPLVWLCIRLIHRDMETACDALALEALGAEQRKGYIRTILHFSGRQGSLRTQAAMGLSGGYATMRKRIRGMFLTKRTGRAARICVAALACLMAFAGFTAGCQPTPTKPVIVNKGDNELDDIIAQTPAPTATYQAPEQWEESMQQKNVKVEVKAAIDIPDASQFPVVSVEALQFQQSDVDKAVEAFFGSATPREYTQYTKQYISNVILDMQQHLADLNSGKYKPDEGEKEQLEAAIKQWEEMYRTAPENAVDDGPADTSLKRTETGGNSVTLVADLGGTENATLSVGNNESTLHSAMSFTNYPTSGVVDTKVQPLGGGKPNGVNTAPEEARGLAEGMLEKMGIADMKLSGVGVVSFLATKTEDPGATSDRQAYQFAYVKSFKGIPMNDYASKMYRKDGGDGESIPDYAPVLSPEQVIIWVDDSGVIRFHWTNPTKMGRILSENVSIKGFEEVKELFRRQIFYHAYTPTVEGYTTAIKIEKAVLSYFLQPVKDEPHQYRAIPVWDFIGVDFDNGETPYRDSYEYTYLTLNAIDGSVIDRSLGY